MRKNPRKLSTAPIQATWFRLSAGILLLSWRFFTANLSFCLVMRQFEMHPIKGKSGRKKFMSYGTDNQCFKDRNKIILKFQNQVFFNKSANERILKL